MKPGREAPCDCGSGKEYGLCCAEEVEPRPPSSGVPTPAELKHLGNLFNARRFAELESQAQTLLELYPDSGVIWELLGMSLQMQGKDSLHAFQKTAELMHADAGAQYNLGAVYKIRGRLDEAVESYRRALKLKPDYAEAHSNLGNVLRDLGQLEDAMASYSRAIKIRPDSAEIYLNLGVVLSDKGQLDDAVTCYRRALELKPDYTDAQSNLLFALNYTAKHTIEDRLAEASRYGRMVAQKVGARFTAWQCADMPDCLRVGVVSGDLWSHPVGYFLEVCWGKLIAGESSWWHIQPTKKQMI
ncbi:MAG: tetratricopeptide repeat protein [Nitrosomonadales bacterium]|nr:tetratricopeptide repeat protein [Nitrosomonadales bacterium]